MNIKKVLVILFIFLLVINSFVLCAFAADKVLQFGDYSFTVNDKYVEHEYYFLMKGSSDRFKYLFVSNIPFSFSFEGEYCYINGKDMGYYANRDNEVYGSFVSFPDRYRFTDFIYSPSFEVISSKILYSNADIKDIDGNVFHPSDVFNAPFFITAKEELASGKFDVLKIDAGDLDKNDDKIVFTIYEGINVFEEIQDYKAIKSFLLNGSSDYVYVVDLNIYYRIPQVKLGIDLSNDKSYMFELKKFGGDEVYSSVSFVVGGLTEGEEIKNGQDITNDKLDEQTNAIKEQTETNKNIFERIGEMLSYINPFSENFFVYKLIELLADMIKSLFVPSEEFMSQWFTDISGYFEDAFGILYYPIDLVIQVLGRFSNIADQEPVISFGNFSLFGGILIPAYSFNFNSLLGNNILKTLHDFYLIVIDVILWLGLLVYCKNVVANIFGGKFTDDVIDEIQDPGGYNRTANNISRYNYAKQSNLKANGKMKGR